VVVAGGGVLLDLGAGTEVSVGLAAGALLAGVACAVVVVAGAGVGHATGVAPGGGGTVVALAGGGGMSALATVGAGVATGVAAVFGIGAGAVGTLTVVGLGVVPTPGAKAGAGGGAGAWATCAGAGTMPVSCCVAESDGPEAVAMTRGFFGVACGPGTVAPTMPGAAGVPAPAWAWAFGGAEPSAGPDWAVAAAGTIRPSCDGEAGCAAAMSGLVYDTPVP
jgi:hypothetical protein